MNPPLLFDILTAVRADIQALNLPGLSAANVVVQKVPGDQAQDLPAIRFPCILIAPHATETTDPLAGTNLRDDVVYPIRITILAADGGDQQFGFQQFLGWRETIRRSFHNQRLTSGLCFTVQVQPLPTVDKPAWSERGLFASGLILNCFSREPRGT
jgi:hypothetical protein